MPYYPALDGLRAIAVLVVVAYHAGTPGFAGGFLGVDVFFVLSGFLITALLRREQARTGRIDLLRFYARRALRLWPALLLMLLAYLLAARLLRPAEELPEHGREALIAALFLSDYARAFWGTPTLVGHTWSLAVEEHFYLLWPAVLLLLPRLPGGVKGQVWAVAGMYVAATLWRDWSVLNGPGWNSVYFRFDTRLSGLMLGSLLALVAWRWREAKALKPHWAAAALIVLAVSCLGFRTGAPMAMVAGVTTVELASAILILMAVSPGNGVVVRSLSHPVLVRLGVLSYGIYLWHHPVLFLVLRDLFPWPVNLCIGLAASVALAALSHATVEALGRRAARSLDHGWKAPRAPLTVSKAALSPGGR